MTQYDERLELAPRDIVARAISFEMTRNNVGNVELDVSHLPSDFVERRFPTISRRCRSLGLDLSKSPIPVAPAAHFSCGGLVTNLHGETTVAGLFALGECATVGLHGANRLASNSLTEAIVMAERTASRINSNTGLDLTYVANIAGGARGTVSSECTRHWQTLRATMSEKVGIVRTRDGLSQAITEIEEIRSDVDSLRRRSGRGRSLAELENGVTVALLTARAASARQESVGCHYLASPQ